MKEARRPPNWPQRLRDAVRRLREYWTLSPVEMGLVLLVTLACGYFFASGLWNQNARLDAIYSFVEPGPDQHTFRINRFVFDPSRNLNTGDWARHESNFYANKAPGTILLGVLVYWPLHWLETALLGLDVAHPLLEVANAYFINLGVSVAFAALGTLLFWRLLMLQKVSRRRALAITLALALGTALFPYSTTLWGTATTTALVIAGYLGLESGTSRSVLVSGACLGFAVCCDYLAFAFVLVAGVYLLSCRPGRVGWFAAGGVAPLLVLMGYHQYCFGSPFTTASSLSQPGFLDSNRWLGMLGWPSPGALFQLTFGPKRGIFWQMPVLALALGGFYYWFKRRRTDPWLWLSAASFFVPLLLVSAFNGWHGGASVCARYLVFALPWLVLSLKELPRTRGWSVALVALATVSSINMLTIAATSTMVPDQLSDPLYSWVYPEFLAGNLGALAQPTRLQALHPAWPAIAPLTCFNLGEVVGLTSYASLLPWLFGCGLLVRFCYRRAGVSRSVSGKDQGRVGAD